VTREVTTNPIEPELAEVQRAFDDRIAHSGNAGPKLVDGDDDRCPTTRCRAAGPWERGRSREHRQAAVVTDITGDGATIAGEPSGPTPAVEASYSFRSIARMIRQQPARERRTGGSPTRRSRREEAAAATRGHHGFISQDKREHWTFNPSICTSVNCQPPSNNIVGVGDPSSTSTRNRSDGKCRSGRRPHRAAAAHVAVDRRFGRDAGRHPRPSPSSWPHVVVGRSPRDGGRGETRSRRKKPPREAGEARSDGRRVFHKFIDSFSTAPRDAAECTKPGLAHRNWLVLVFNVRIRQRSGHDSRHQVKPNDPTTEEQQHAERSRSNRFIQKGARVT
jgi:hypothetical protein